MFTYIITFAAVLSALIVFYVLLLGLSMSPKIQTMLANKWLKVIEKVEDKIDVEI